MIEPRCLQNRILEVEIWQNRMIEIEMAGEDKVQIDGDGGQVDGEDQLDARTRARER